MQLTKQEVMSKRAGLVIQCCGSGEEGETASKPIHNFIAVYTVTNSRTNLMLFFAIGKFSEKIVLCFSLQAKEEKCSFF